MKRLLLVIAVVAAGGCAEPQRRDATYDRINRELDRSTQNRSKEAAPDAVSQALLPPLAVQMPQAEARPLLSRFDLNVNNAPANQVFMAVVSGTRYSMIVHPDVKDLISVNLKGVTVIEALDTLRDLYGYEYKVQDTRIMVQPVTVQTRVFQVNYLQATRKGQTDVRVSSGSITDSPTPAAAGAGAAGGTASRSTASSRVSTTTESDFWTDVTKSLNAIVVGGEGRSVIVNPQSGVIVVRALPSELRSVESFLKAMKLVVERQVVLEAKIIEVTLRESAQSGINWAGFKDGGLRATGGVISPGATLRNTGTLPNSPFTATLGDPAALAAGAITGGIFGLALQTSNFAALLSFLETQGTLNVLSSPRIATINNQKAVLKVGTDEFFVTNISTTSTSSGTGTTTSPTITVQPFFSGIALDVTPQIDENDNILLHIHPSVSSVTEKRKVIDLGSAGSFQLPLASSDINESDTVVRVQNNNIVAIGGLMKQQTITDRSQVPGAADSSLFGALFRQRTSTVVKTELVILLKPVIIHGDRNWEKDLVETQERIRGMEQRQQPGSR